MNLKEQAESLGIPTTDADGKAIHHKTLKKLIDDHGKSDNPEVDTNEEAAELNKDGFEAGKPITTDQLMKHIAQQRQKTGIVQPATKPKRKDKRTNRSKIHAGAISKAK